MRISIIGNGNLAQNLAKTFLLSGHELIDMHAKNPVLLNQFCNNNKINAVDKLANLNTEIDILIISISDSAINEVVKALPRGDYSVFHTSGSISIEVFEKSDFSNYGVFYPLYSFSKDRQENFINIPIMIEFSNDFTQGVIEELSKSISNNVSYVNSAEREIYHLTGIFANNFTNHLLALTQELVIKHNLDFEQVKPIVEQTANKIISAKNISKIQTGPAKRGNVQIINQHLKLLENDDELMQIYKELSQSIIRKHH